MPLKMGNGISPLHCFFALSRDGVRWFSFCLLVRPITSLKQSVMRLAIIGAAYVLSLVGWNGFSVWNSPLPISYASLNCS